MHEHKNKVLKKLKEVLEKQVNIDNEPSVSVTINNMKSKYSCTILIYKDNAKIISLISNESYKKKKRTDIVHFISKRSKPECIVETIREILKDGKCNIRGEAVQMNIIISHLHTETFSKDFVINN